MDNEHLIKKLGIAFILIASFVSFILGISMARASASNLDIRFLIDMSYNMKKEDLNNNRIRSLQKIVKALPSDARSGVWTYGKYVNMLVPLGTSDSKWKKQAVYKIDSINGFGDYTNISSAIENAIHGWQDKSNYKKYIVILTNGGLNLSDSIAKNNLSRNQLLTRTIPKLAKSGIQLHTISLGKNSDDKLLKILSEQTNGKWYWVNQSDNLGGVMNHVYAQIVKSSEINSPKINSQNISNLSKVSKVSKVTPVSLPIKQEKPETESIFSKDGVNNIALEHQVFEINNNNNKLTNIITNVSPSEDLDNDWVTLSSG